MCAHSRASPFLLALILQAARTGSANGAARQDLTCRVGDSATLLLEHPQASKISNLVWRSSSRGPQQAVANWEPGNPANVLNTDYAGRVTFLETTWSLEIRNLSKADGGIYSVVELRSDSETLLKEYTLVVFDFSLEESRSVNGSCTLTLRCEVGAGAETPVTYRWSPSGPEGQGSILRLTLHPAEKHKQYTCTATTLGTQRSVTITPYDYCPAEAAAAGLLAPTALGLALLAPLLLLP